MIWRKRIILSEQDNMSVVQGDEIDNDEDSDTEKEATATRRFFIRIYLGSTGKKVYFMVQSRQKAKPINARWLETLVTESRNNNEYIRYIHVNINLYALRRFYFIDGADRFV